METIECDGGIVIRDGSRCAYFIPSEMRLFALNASADLPIGSIARMAVERHSAPSTSVRPFIYDHAPREALFPILDEGATERASSAKPVLGRLTLNISNRCNLACSYCYADQGRYNAEERLMTPVAVEEALRRTLELYREINVVHFFGGEPLMNLEAIDAAGDFLDNAVRHGILSAMPRMVLTTNGTWSGPEIIRVLQRWDISLTVSWDGAREIHDKCRPMLSGASSYELLADSMQRFRESHIPFEIECTYNGHHRQSGISIVDLMNFFHRETGQRVLHIAPAFLPRPRTGELMPRPDYVDLVSLADDYRVAARVSIENLISGKGPVLQFAYRVADHLAKRTPAQAYCPAFFSQITVATDGSVYPCFMLAGDTTYRMGNLLDGSFPGPDAARVLRRYFEEFNERPQAWYSCLSEGCVAGEAIVAGVMSEAVFAPIQEAIAEECVLQLAVHFTNQ